MTKKILLLTARRDGAQFAGSKPEADMLAGCARLNAATDKAVFYTAAMNELVISVFDSVVTIYDGRNKCDLSTYDAVQLRVTLFARDHFQAVAFYLEHHNISFIDAKDAEGTFYGKISQMVAFALAGLPVPDTIAVWNSATHRQAVRDKLQLPFIFKDNHGSKGSKNFLVRDWPEFEALVAEHASAGFVAQPFIANDGDYRVLALGAQRVVMYRKARAGSHMNNTSQGGQGTIVPLADCPPAVLDLADRAVKVFGRKIGGADILIDRATGIPYILEVNDTPAIFAGQFKQEKAASYLEFITQEIIQGKSL